jgi:hypothetical protein
MMIEADAQAEISMSALEHVLLRHGHLNTAKEV